MDDREQARSSSEEYRSMEAEEDLQFLSLPDLYDHIQHELSSGLSETTITAIEEKLDTMKKSSYHLRIQHDLFDACLCTVGPSHPLWALIDQVRLNKAITTGRTQVELTLTVLDLIFQQIVKGRQGLEDFVVSYNQGLVDCDTLSTVKQNLQKTQKYVNDFKTRTTCNLGPLNLNNQLIHAMENPTTPQLDVYVTIKKPVVFDRSKSFISSNSAYLYWYIKGEEFMEPSNRFMIKTRNKTPAADEELCFQSACHSYSARVRNLIKGRIYEFSVMCVDNTLIYRTWIDTITMKTRDAAK